MRVILDTNVLIAGLGSRRGASFQILSMLGQGLFETVVSVPLVLEYEAVLKVQADTLRLREKDIDAVVDYVCQVSSRRKVFFLWRPMLRDPGDEFILELAVEASCDAIVTHNVRDFAGAERFGVRVMTPGEFLKTVRRTS
jgi:putative PIN family toxin of toxin-antitoxin system